MKTIKPELKWKNIETSKIFIGHAGPKLTKGHRGPLYKSLKLGYKYIERRKDEWKTFIAVFYSLINALFQERRIVFATSFKGLNQMLSNDKNFKSPVTLKRQEYQGLIRFLVNQKCFKVLNLERKGKEVLILELTDPDFLAFFHEMGYTANRQTQLDQAIEFSKFKKSSLLLTTQNLEHSTKNIEHTFSFTRDELKEKDLNSQSERKTKPIEHLSSSETTQLQSNVNNTSSPPKIKLEDEVIQKLKTYLGKNFTTIKNLSFLVQIWPVIDKQLKESIRLDDKVMLIERLDRLGSVIYDGIQKGGKISDKVNGLLDYMQVIGPVFPLEVFQEVFNLAFAPYKNSETHQKVLQMYQIELKRCFEQNLLKYNQMRANMGLK